MTATTATTTPPVRTGQHVTVGDRLPTLALPITPRTVVMGASATRDWQPQHHDHKHCVEVAGLPDIFLNTPHQAGLIQRYLTDWGGPHARLGRLGFRMKRSVVPGDELHLDAEVTAVTTDRDVTWVDLAVTLTVADDVDDVDDAERVAATTCTARLALPSGETDNPWRRTGPDWQP